MKKIICISLFLLSSMIIFAQNPYEDMGIDHNIQVTQILKQINSIPKTTTEVKAFLCPILIKNLGKCSFGPAGEDTYSWIDKLPISILLKAKVKETIDLQNENLTVSQFWNIIQSKEREASSLFAGEELRIYFEHLAVAKYSYKYWMPISKGGLNGISNIGAGGYATMSPWGHVFVCDCVGGLLGGAVGYIGVSVFNALDTFWVN